MTLAMKLNRCVIFSSKIALVKFLPLHLNGGGQQHKNQQPSNKQLKNTQNKQPQTKLIHFHLPTFDNDAIQSTIFNANNFFDIHIIQKADKFLQDNANILDIGANIGNNAVYYAMIRNANKIYAFEPIKDTFEILRKNIELNALQDKIYPFNVALGLQEGKAVIKNRPVDNCGGTEIKTDNDGDLIVKNLDSFEFSEKIDFVKIDVEGFESQVLLGAKAFLAKHKPIMVIEIHAHKFEESINALHLVGYEIIEKISEIDFICKAK